MRVIGWMVRRQGFVALGAWLAIAPVGLSGCAKTLEINQIEAVIRQDLAEKKGLAIRSIDCPDTVEWQPGKSFECTAALNSNGGFFITVQQQDEYGKVKWDVPNAWRVLNLKKLEAEFQQSLQGNSRTKLFKVDCEGLYRATQAGDSFECQLIQPVAQHQSHQKQSPQLAQALFQTRSPAPTPVVSPAARLPQPDVILVKVAAAGQVTWQIVHYIAVPGKEPAKPVLGQSTPNQQVSGQSQVQTAEPAAIASPVPTSAAIGVKDESGWVELTD